MIDKKGTPLEYIEDGSTQILLNRLITELPKGDSELPEASKAVGDYALILALKLKNLNLVNRLENASPPKGWATKSARGDGLVYDQNTGKVVAVKLSELNKAVSD